MIELFERETAPLSTYEETVLLPAVMMGLSDRVGKENAIKNRDIITRLRRHDLTEIRVRKIINHIRRYGLIHGLVACYAGYYIATSREELETYEASLMSREQAIREVRLSIRRQRMALFPEAVQTQLF